MENQRLKTNNICASNLTQSAKDLKTFPWHYSYKTSALNPDGHPVNILHDFYIPALKRSVRYDRVAGYFRSSSLAAASQGFSAFTEGGGKMRLIAGADLNDNDVAAILEGDQKRLEDRLCQEIGERATWPEDVSRGIELLAWMVANDILDVRVAFRQHGNTGTPMPFLAADDGYVHEKWALFYDAGGNRIYISGSLNESQKALVHNAENIDVHADWWGDIERKRADEAQASFEDLWHDRNAHMKVMTLPEAVRQKLVQIGKQVKRPLEIDGSSAVCLNVAPPSAMELLQFAVIKDAPKMPAGRYVGMETAPIEPWPHQEVVARRLVETWPYSFLLCDEVGLGKTIEAGLAIRSLYLSGIIQRVLIAPPAGLTRQWQREMATKFFLPFARALTGSTVRHAHIFPAETISEGKNLFEPDLCITSTGLISRPDRHSHLAAAKRFDVVLVDEAHAARRRNPKNGARSQPRFGNLYRTLANHLRSMSSCLWMATATPMQLDWIEVFDLLSLINRVGPFQYDPSLMWTYYRTVANLVQGVNIDNSPWDLLRRSIVVLQQHDPFLWKFIQDSVIDGRMRLAVRRWLDHGIIPRGTDRQQILRLIFAAAPLSRVMLRHGRALLEIYREKGQLGANLARREILPVPRIVLEGLEKQAYDDLEAYCRELTAKIADQGTTRGWRASLGFYLGFLRLRLASSLYALRETLRRRQEKVLKTLNHIIEDEAPPSDFDEFDPDLDEEEVPDDRYLDSLLQNRTAEDLAWEHHRLEQMLAVLENLSGMPLKMKALLQVLEHRRLPGHRVKQTVIFTRFYDTLKDLVGRMRQIDSALLIGTYSGKGGQYVDPGTNRLRGTERDEIKHRFLRGEIDVLVCTDAAAEGLNLQTADLLINYDLPWNPMKVEQRIGRIDRIGQKHTRIEVLNLCYANSAEQIVYERLLQRLMETGLVVGSQQISMLPVTRDEFNDLAAGELTEKTLVERAKARIAEQQQRTACMEIPAKDLYEIYLRRKNRFAAKKTPVSLGDIWEAMAGSAYLRDLGCTVEPDKDQQVMTMCGLELVADETLMTIDRVLYDQGVVGDSARMHFASYGDPVFNNLLDAFAKYELPQCVMRLEENVPDIDVQVVAYAAACIDADRQRVVSLITSCEDLKGLILDESVNLGQTDLSVLRKELHDIVRLEFDPTRSVARLEKENKRTAYSQAILNLLVGKSLFAPPTVADTDLFSTAITHFDQLIEERNQLLVAKMPANLLRDISRDLLFDIPVPQVGDEASPTLPIFLVAGAVDASCRIADGIRRGGANLTVDAVKRRLEREAMEHFKRYRSLT